jgi:hypothetical protein
LNPEIAQLIERARDDRDGLRGNRRRY